MLTPYDWQEGIGHRAGYVESKLAQGAPVLALSIEQGIVMFTYRRHARKIYEIYDQLMVGSIGQQSDVESLRVAALDFAHQEGFNRSEQDVTIQRVVTALSGSIKRAFGDFNTAPFVARALFAEVGDMPAEDSYIILDYDGDFTQRRASAYCTPTEEIAPKLKKAIAAIKPKGLSPESARDALRDAWAAAHAGSDWESEDGSIPEAALLERGRIHENRFIRLTPDE